VIATVEKTNLTAGEYVMHYPAGSETAVIAPWGDGTQAHHVLPQKFAKQFQEAGINIHDPHYGAWWRAGAHRRAATKYNAKWEEFLFQDEPPSAEQILQFGRKIAKEYGLQIYF
jgi:hypothetical protein